jgi:uncharacterized protein (TIGR03382 family)
MEPRRADDWADERVRPSMTGGDWVGQLPATLPKTIGATDQLLRCGCPLQARHRALDLLLALAAVECHASSGGPGLTLAGLLREVVILTKRLVGGTWLDANAEETASFTRLQSSLGAPPLAELDDLLACLLSDRFGLPRASRHAALSSRTTGGPQQAPVTALDQVVRSRARSAAGLPDSRSRSDRDARQFNVTARLDGAGEGESGSCTAEQLRAHSCDTAGGATIPATAAAVPAWIWLLRRVNVGMQSESRSASRRRSAG